MRNRLASSLIACAALKSRTWLLLLAGALLICVEVHAATVVAPNVSVNTPGGGAQLGPFSSDGSRFLNIYNSSEFASAMPQGGIITALLLRLDETSSGSLSVEIPELEIRMSTSPLSASAVSNKFADYVGADERIVFPRGAIHFETSSGPAGTRKPFDLRIPFSTAFHYLPSGGSLAVDLWTYRGSTEVLLIDSESAGVAGALAGPMFHGEASFDLPASIIQLEFEQVPEQAKIVLPSRTATKPGEGNQFSFQQSGARYLNIYDATEFASLPTGGGLITGISFRLDERASASQSVTVPAVEIRMSTSPSTSSSINEQPSRNIGPDETVVFRNGPLPLELQSSTSPEIPAPFSPVVSLTTPFSYDPSKGSLSMDLRTSTEYPGIVMDGDGNHAIALLGPLNLDLATVFPLAATVIQLQIVPTPLSAEIKSIRVLNTSVQIEFTFSGTPSALKLEACPTVNGVFAAEQNVVMITVSTNTVQATTAASSMNRFFRIRLDR